MINLWNMFSLRNVVYWLFAVLGAVLGYVYGKHVKDEKREQQQFKEFMNFLDCVSYQYTVCQCVEEAVLESLWQTSGKLQELLEEIYRLLLAEDAEEIRLQKRSFEHFYYYEFLIYSYMAMEYGDDIHDSVYLHNISFLKQQVFIWVLDREKLMHNLSGLAFLILLPIQFLKLIELWANYNLQDLERYYDGGYGIITRFLLLFFTILSYSILLSLRSNYEVIFCKSTLLTGLGRKQPVKRYFEWWAEYHPKKVRQLTELLRKSSARITLKELCLARVITAALAALVTMLMISPMWKSGNYTCILIGLIIVMIAGISYEIPVWYFMIRNRLMHKEKEDEVYFFYAIVQMAACIGKGDVDDIIEWMELGGIIFSPSLQECIDEYAFDNEYALDHLKALEPFPPFMKLMDALQMSEQVGMKHAVIPLKMEQSHYIEKRKQDNDIWTANKEALGKFIAFIPMICTIGLYLIIPFVLESIVQLKEYVQQIQTVF